MSQHKLYNPAVPIFKGDVDAGIALGGFPLHMSTATIKQIAAAFEVVFGPAMVLFQDLMMTHLPGPTKYAKDWADATVHPLVKEMPLSDPVDVAFCIVMYFVFLAFFFLVGRGTGKLQLRGFGILHNLFLAVLSLYMAAGLVWDAVQLYGFSLWNNHLDTSHPIAIGVRNMAWVFLVSKLPEYFDTYIMVLKHNYRQVSFLHLYHHSSVFVVGYLFFSYTPGGDVTWAGMVNSGIHVVMYIYYLLNLVFQKGPVKEFLQRNKFIITQCQITQFVLNFVQAIYVLFIAKQMNTVAEPMWINLFYMITMITLFSNFMIQNKKQAAAARKAKEAAKKKAE